MEEGKTKPVATRSRTRGGLRGAFPAHLGAGERDEEEMTYMAAQADAVISSTLVKKTG